MGASSSKLISDPSALSGLEFDYIVVGGGTAGCVLASRLSEDPNVSVLLIEAGKTNAGVLQSQIPLACPSLFKGTYDWNLETVPQPALGNAKSFWPRGKMLGGTSSINAVMYHHCAPSDFDEWGRLTASAPEGSPKWSYEAMRPYLMKSENFNAPTSLPPAKGSNSGKEKASGNPGSFRGPRASERRVTQLDHTARGKGGPWQTRFGPFSEICEDAVHASEQIGIPYTPDFNTPRGTLGASLFPTFVAKDGQRSSSATAYLTPAVQGRKNLTIALECSVTRIILSDDATTVKSVEVARTPSKDGAPAPTASERWSVGVRKEAVVSAGTCHTPHILMLSGIGPKQELEKVGIKPVKELNAVGQNLLDHLITPISFRAARGTTLAYLGKPLGGIVPLVKWFVNGSGIYASTPGQGAAFVKIADQSLPIESGKEGHEAFKGDTSSGPSAPDVELVYTPFSFIDHGQATPPKEYEVFTIFGSLLRPESRGTVTLNSANPFDKPIIDPKYLSAEYDWKVHRRFMRLALRIARAEPLAQKLVLPKVGENIDKSASNFFWPGDADPDTVTDAELDVAIAKNSQTFYHPVGTARMGCDPTTSVVDPSLRVHGIKNLRIVDASIFPNQVSGHPTAPIIAAAERCADLIKGL